MTCITDGANSCPRPEGFVSNVNSAEVVATLEAEFLPTDKITLTFIPVVLETASRVVVVDTGMGEAEFKAGNGTRGQFHSNLKTAGYNEK